MDSVFFLSLGDVTMQTAKETMTRTSLVDVAITPDSRRGVHCAVGVALPGGLRVKKHRCQQSQPPVGYHRGVIQGFSSRSRHRMIAELQTVDWDNTPAFFTTLTFNDDKAFDDWESWKKDLQAWKEKLLYRYRHHLAGAIWKLELQDRKSGANKGAIAPHFHVIIFWKHGAVNMTRFRRWCNKAWHSRCDVQRATNTTGVAKSKLLSYLSKYMGKIWMIGGAGVGRTKSGKAFDKRTGEVLNTGRCWGTWGDVPTRTIATFSMDVLAYERFTENIRAKGAATGSWYQSHINSNWDSFQLWGDGQEMLDDLLAGIEGVRIDIEDNLT